MLHDACPGVVPHGTAPQGMCRQEPAKRPEPQGIGLIFAAEPTAQSRKSVLHLSEHLSAAAYVPGDVDLAVPQADLAVGGIGPDPEVGEKPRGKVALEQFRGDATKGSRPPEPQAPQDVGLDE